MDKKIEELSLNAWPALQTFLYDGWLLRFANGYSKRSNSVSPLYAGEIENMLEKIRHCETVYEAAGLTPLFKITPFVHPGHLDTLLEEQGYELLDEVSVQLLDLSLVNAPKPSQVEVKIYTEVDSAWLAALASLSQINEMEIETVRLLYASPHLQKGFFVLLDGTTPIACGVGVIEQGYVGLHDIVTAAAYRGRGYGQQLITQILDWARKQGALHSYLHVVKDNTPAVKLYAKLGYKESYTYWFRKKV